MKKKALKATFLFCSLFISAGWYLSETEIAVSSDTSQNNSSYQFLKKEQVTIDSSNKGQSEADLMMQNIKNQMEEKKEEIEDNQQIRDLKRDPSGQVNKDERILNPQNEQMNQEVQPIINQIRQRWANSQEIIQLLDETSILVKNMKEKTQTLFEWSLNAKDQNEEEKLKKIELLMNEHNQVLVLLAKQEAQLKTSIQSPKALRIALKQYNNTLDQESNRLKDSINQLISSWYK